MSEMVERVARAIAKEHGFEDVADFAMYRGLARAAIEAMREPTREMEYMGGTKCEEMMFAGDPEATGIIFKDMGIIFRTMIDAALLPKDHLAPSPSSPTPDALQPGGDTSKPVG